MYAMAVSLPGQLRIFGEHILGCLTLMSMPAAPAGAGQEAQLNPIWVISA
jgi:hypothetical protein